MREVDNAAGLVLKAVAFAAKKHRDQRRKDTEASPYINHPIALANLLANEGDVTEMDVLCAALLHDTIEDTKTTAGELSDQFGAKIAGIVQEVTDDKSLDKRVRKQMQIEHAPHCSYEAKLVKLAKLANKICNLRDILDSPPADWSAERKKEYFAWAAKVVAGLRGANNKLEKLFDEVFARQGSIEESVIDGDPNCNSHHS